MAHIIQPITVDGTAYCCKCYGVSEALGRGTKGVLTDNAFALNGGIQTAVITLDCSYWTLLDGTVENVDVYELWWYGGDMDDTMKYTDGDGVEYFANDAMRFPLFAPNGVENDDDEQDPWQTSGGVVGSKAFRKVGRTDEPDTTYGESWEYYDGSKLNATVDPAGGDAPALAELAIQNWIGASGGDDDNHYWKQIYDEYYSPEGEITFGVSCGTTVEIDLEMVSFPETTWEIDVDIYIDGVLDSTETFSYPLDLDASVSFTVTGGPCGSLVTLHAYFPLYPTLAVGSNFKLKTEVTSIT